MCLMYYFFSFFSSFFHLTFCHLFGVFSSVAVNPFSLSFSSAISSCFIYFLLWPSCLLFLINSFLLLSVFVLPLIYFLSDFVFFSPFWFLLISFHSLSFFLYSLFDVSASRSSDWVVLHFSISHVVIILSFSLPINPHTELHLLTLANLSQVQFPLSRHSPWLIYMSNI